MNIYATRIGSAPGTARTVHVATPEFDKAWYEAYVADRRARGVSPYGVHMDGDPMNGRGGRGGGAVPDGVVVTDGRRGKPGIKRPERHKKVCINGHAMTEENATIVHTNRGTRRKCRECKRIAESRRRERKTVCGKGHKFTPENTYIDSHGRRCCRECRRIAQVKRRAAARGTEYQDGRRWRAHKTFCPHGHEYTPENTYINNRGVRECRKCINSRSRRNYAARTAAKRASIAQD